MQELIKKEIDGVIKKINNNMRLYKNETPKITSSLKYSDNMSQDGDWTGSFWLGMVIMAAAYCAEDNISEYIEYIDSYYDFYSERLESGYKDHDLGFLYQLYAVDAFRLTNDNKYREMAVKAAQLLMCRYNKNGGFIRAWRQLVLPQESGRIIIDCMMNLPLLFCASQMSGMKYLEKGAANHADAALNCIREDGSIYHTYFFDTISGEPLYGANEGGYDDESCWSRGLAWAVYGFYLAWQHTGKKKYLDVSFRTADYFISHLNDDYMPMWDFAVKEGMKCYGCIDTSAAAIAASAFYRLYDVSENEKYRDYADKMLMTMMTKYSHAHDENSEVLLEKCYCGGFDENGERIVNQWSAIFGDYFYMEALLKRSGFDIDMWKLN